MAPFHFRNLSSSWLRCVAVYPTLGLSLVFSTQISTSKRTFPRSRTRSSEVPRARSLRVHALPTFKPNLHAAWQARLEIHSLGWRGNTADDHRAPEGGCPVGLARRRDQRRSFRQSHSRHRASGAKRWTGISE